MGRRRRPSTAKPKQHGHSSFFHPFFTKTKFATAAAVLSAPLGYYYTQVHLPHARRVAELLKQQRPERSTPVFTTGGEPISSITQLVPKETSLIRFYFNSLYRLTQFFLRSSYVFFLLLKYGWTRTFFVTQHPATKDGKIDKETVLSVQHEKELQKSKKQHQHEEHNNKTTTQIADNDDVNEIIDDKSKFDPILMQVGEELARVFSLMGGSYVKLGQWCATRSDVFPREVCEALELLYDKAQPHAWKETEKMVNPATSRRHRDASSSLSMILVGLPLYFYHWRIIAKDSKNRKEENLS